MLSVSSKKLVSQAQGVVVYFESQDDLEKLGKLLQIYSGVPLKVYFGPKRYANFQHFFRFEEAGDLVETLCRGFEQLTDCAEQIYTRVLKKEPDGRVTVDSMIREMPKSKDIIEEDCVALFQKKTKGKKQTATKGDDIGKDVVVGKQKFCNWWREGKLDEFEKIKYYLIGWMIRQIKQNKMDPAAAKHVKEFRSYLQKRKEIKILQDHYDNNFTLKVEGFQAKETATAATASKVQEEKKTAGGILD